MTLYCSRAAVELAVVEQVFCQAADGVEIVAVENDGVAEGVNGVLVILALLVGLRPGRRTVWRSEPESGMERELERVRGVAFVGVKHGQRGDGFFGAGIEFDGGLEFGFGLLQVVVQAIEAAEQKVIIDAVGIELDDLLVLFDGQLQNVVGAGAAGHVAQRAQVDAAEKLVGFEVFGIALDDVLRFLDGLGDAAGFYVEFGQGGGQKFRRGIGINGEAVFLSGFGGEVAAAVGGNHFLVHVGEGVVVVGGGVVELCAGQTGSMRRLGRCRLAGRGWGRLGVGSRSPEGELSGWFGRRRRLWPSRSSSV